MLSYCNVDQVLVSARSACFDLPVPGDIIVLMLIDRGESGGESSSRRAMVFNHTGNKASYQRLHNEGSGKSVPLKRRLAQSKPPSPSKSLS